MQTDFKAIQAIVSNGLGAHHIGAVIEKAGFLLSSIEAHTLTSLISDLLFYVSNPDCAEELSKDDFVNLTNESLSLVNMLTDLRGSYAELILQVKETGHE